MRQKNCNDQVFTYQARMRVNNEDSALLSSMSCLLNRVEHSLFRDLSRIRAEGGEKEKEKISNLKTSYIKRFRITARQFNAVRAMLEGKISSIRESQKLQIKDLKQRISSLKASIEKHEKKKEHRTVHGKKRRLAKLHAQLRNLEQLLEQGKTPLCFGSRRLFRKQFALKENTYQSHDEWKKDWQATRNESFFLIGSKDETSGNQSCVASLEEGGISLRIRLPDALAAHGKYLIIKDIQFAYGQEAIIAALMSHSGNKEDAVAISYRFLLDKRGWRIFVSVPVTEHPKVTRQGLGVLGIDINADHLVVVETDRYGNPVTRKSFALCTYGTTKHQAEALIGDVVASLVDWCVRVKKPIVIEKLSFGNKKNTLRESGTARYARMLSSLSYSTIISMIKAKSFRCGVHVKEVNPAYTSIIGRVKFAKRYGFSGHESAALCIGRRCVGFSERFPRHPSSVPDGRGSHVTLSLPVRNRGKHVWSSWREIQRELQKWCLQHTSGRIKRSSSQACAVCCDSTVLEVVGGTPAHESITKLLGSRV